eukprot:gene7357-7425_t
MTRLWFRVVFILIISGVAHPALAQSVMKQCSEAYQAAKAANQLNGETWPQFLSHCSVGRSVKTEASPKVEAVPAPSAAAPVVNPASPAATPAAAPAIPAAVPGAVSTSNSTPATLAVTPPADPAAPTTPATSRQKLCGAEWRANKDTLKVQYGTWPKFWSACNLRMKSTGK